MSSHYGYIPDDGYTESGYVRESPRLHQAVRFDFRPMTAHERTKLMNENRGLAGDKGSLNTANNVAKKIVKWDLKSKGKDVPVSAQSLLKIKAALYDRLVAIVMGFEPPDEDPEEGLDESLAKLEAELAANEQGVLVGELKESGDQKNS